MSGGQLILVVEDDPSLRLLCRVNLELDGFRVEEAETFESARAAITEERPAVVFLDVFVGTEDCGALLDELHVAAIPVVLVSGVAEVDGYRDRVAEVLPKPFDPSVLGATAARLAAVGNVSAP